MTFTFLDINVLKFSVPISAVPTNARLPHCWPGTKKQEANVPNSNLKKFVYTEVS